MIEKLKEYALENYIPIVRDETSLKLIEECKKLKPKNILEIGTAIGYSGLLMLENCDATLYTIEKNEERFKEAEHTFKECKFSNRVKQFLGDAYNVLQELSKDSLKFDLIFLDGPKGQYIKYLPYLKSMLNIGGEIFADNVLMHGLIENYDQVTHKNRTMVRNMKKFNETILGDEDFTSQMYEIEDGFIIAYKNK